VIKERDGVMLAITGEGKIYLNNEQIERDKMAEALRNLKTAGEERVFVRADKDVAYGVVMDVIGNVKSVGINEVGMITEIDRKR
jgi:biopolymer transport protein TolR